MKKIKNDLLNLAWFRFYEELNDFLPAARKKILFSYSFDGNPSVKDAIEALGVPHAEVDLILVNGHSVDFTHRLKNGDSVSVYPVFESFDISPVTHLRDKPLRDTKFIADVHLGKLARNLRLTGFDVCYRPGMGDTEIIGISLSEKRIILTHDRELLKNKLVTHGYYVRSQVPDEQLKEVFIRFQLKSLMKLFSRCMECNSLLSDVPKEEIADHVLPKTIRYFEDFKRCPGCGRIYWNGSHYERMKRHIDSIISDF